MAPCGCLIFQDVPGDVAEFHGVHVVVLRDGFPHELLAGGGLSRNEALAAHAAKEILAGVAGDGERRLAVADAVDEKLGFDGVVHEGVEDDAGEVVDDGAANAAAEGGSAAFGGVPESAGVLAGGINAEGGEAAVHEAALGEDFLPARCAVDSAGGIGEEVLDGERGAVVEDEALAGGVECDGGPVLFVLADVGAGDDVRGFDGACAARVVATEGEDVGVADAGLDLLPRHGHGGVREILQAVERVLVAEEFHGERAEGAAAPRGIKAVQVEGSEAALRGGVGGLPDAALEGFDFLAVVPLATASLAGVAGGFFDEGHVPLAVDLGVGVPFDLFPEKLDAVVAMRALEHEFFLRAFLVFLPDRAVGRGGRGCLDAERADEGLCAVLGEEEGAGFLVGLAGEFVDLIHEEETGGAAGEVGGGVAADEDEGAPAEMLLEVFEAVAVRGLLGGERGAVVEERKPAGLGETAGEALGGHDPHDRLGLVANAPGGACLDHRGLAGLRAEDEHKVGDIDIAETLERLAEVGREAGGEIAGALGLAFAQDNFVGAPLIHRADVDRGENRLDRLRYGWKPFGHTFALMVSISREHHSNRDRSISF